jgi:hypothetical protein
MYATALPPLALCRQRRRAVGIRPKLQLVLARGRRCGRGRIGFSGCPRQARRLCVAAHVKFKEQLEISFVIFSCKRRHQAHPTPGPSPTCLCIRAPGLRAGGNRGHERRLGLDQLHDGLAVGSTRCELGLHGVRHYGGHGGHGGGRSGLLRLNQGLPLAHFAAQRKHLSWNA